ncbi:MAG: outer membrane beta-barrel protein [Bacteroidota bacterium]|jgi:Outer membrane protein beta-barrel domain
MSQLTNNNSGPGKNIDDLFRDSLGKQELSPSPRVWKTLNLKLLARELMHFNFINIPTIALVSVAGGIVLVASLTWWALQPGSRSTSETPEKPSAQVIQPSAPTNKIIEPSVKAVTATGNISTHQSVTAGKAQAVVSPPKRLQKSEALIASNAKIEKKPLAATLHDASPAPVPVVAPAASPEVKTSVTTERTASVKCIQYMDALEFSSFDLMNPPDTLTFIRSGEVFKYVREKAPVPSFFSASLGIAPEMALYSSNGTKTQEFNYFANAGVAYHFSRFSVRTGIGLGYTYDEGNYKVQYRSNDSVSYYKEVIGYYPDPVNSGKFIYITKDHAIYDSVTHMADDRTRNRYTYLQIPLLLGYNVFETRNFSLGIEAGPAVSFLISEKKAQPVIDIPNGRLIALQDYSPTHQPTNWQLWVRLSLEYQFTRNWGMFINPYYKYFITSPTQSAEGGSRNTQAFGIDLGIQYMFGRKSNKK